MATTAALPAYMLPGVSVHQPNHLEGDAALATEILPGPPSLVSAQQSVQKRDPKKPSTMYSYLPPSDPGSTYSGVMHGTLVGLEEPRSKRPRADKGASGRAQRASARNQNATTAPLDPSTSIENSAGLEQQSIAAEPVASGSGDAGDEAMVVSHSDSSVNLQDPPAQPPTIIKVGKRDKGKGKESGTPPATLRAKDDAKAASSRRPTPEPTSNLLNNNDHCSACRSNGALVYCDGCPKAFHLWCLDPPMESIDEGDSRWFCPACVIRKNPPRKPPPSLMGPLIHQLELSTPVEFQLPDDIRNFFRDVGTSARGTYVDLQETKPPRLNRHGQLEDRDPHRLKDKNGAPVLCYQCGMSALPSSVASTVPASKRPRQSTSKAVTPEAFKDILSCDFCSLHWHLDCLNPPLSSMPPFNRKWMCPNHAEKLIPSKRRIPKQNAPPIDITKPKQWNNGHIDVIQPEPSTAEARNRVHADEVLINGRRYRVPEKIIVFDFWNKVSKVDLSENKDVDMGADSGLSSPLTSLSSLEEDLHERLPVQHPDEDDMRAAQALFDLSRSKTAPKASERPLPIVTLSSSSSLPTASSTAAPSPTITTSSRPSRGAKQAANLKITTVINAGLNGTDPSASTTATSLTRGTAPTVSVPVRRRAKRGQPATASANGTRRSRSSNTTQESTISAPPGKTFSIPSAAGCSSANPSAEFRTISVKMEEDEVSLSSTNASAQAAEVASSSTSRRRTVARKGPTATKTDAKPKRGKKRKATDDELPEPNSKAATSTDGKRARVVSKDSADKLATLVSTPSRARTPSSPSGPASPLTPLTTTPKLKIRLPRLNGSATRTTGPSLLNGNADTPTRL